MESLLCKQSTHVNTCGSTAIVVAVFRRILFLFILCRRYRIKVHLNHLLSGLSSSHHLQLLFTCLPNFPLLPFSISCRTRGHIDNVQCTKKLLIILTNCTSVFCWAKTITSWGYCITVSLRAVYYQQMHHNKL